MTIKPGLLFCVALAYSTMLRAQLLNDSSAFLLRYKTNTGTALKIPLTNFYFINNAGLVKSYRSGWIMKWDVIEKKNTNLLFIEMNSTDVKGWWGNDDISGSVQLVFELPQFPDSIFLDDLTEKSKGIYMINNYGGIGAKKESLKGKLKITKYNSGALVNCSLDLVTEKPSTKQQFGFVNTPVRAISFSEYQSFENRRDSTREKETEIMAGALTDAIMTRDSIWEINNKKLKDSLEMHPYTGPFRFWASVINKPGYSRITYAINYDSLIIKEGPYDFIYLAKNYPEDSVYFKIALTDEQRLNLTRIGQKTMQYPFKSTYTNFCIMDGLEVSFAFEWSYKQQDVTISNFYEPAIAEVIDYINGISPEHYHIWYNKNRLLQEQKDCETRRQSLKSSH